MIGLIEKARSLYPKDGTQQFYRVIREQLEVIMANAPDLKNESFENNGMFVVKQLFTYKGVIYCWWVCEFPNYSSDTKRNAFYGLDINLNNSWKLLWTELDLEHYLVFILRMRVAARLDNKELIHAVNPFEKAIDDAPYSSDIIKQCQIILNIINEFNAVGNDPIEKKTKIVGDNKFVFYFFKKYGYNYLWSELYINGYLEGFQLEALYTSRVPYILFSNNENVDPIGVVAIEMCK